MQKNKRRWRWIFWLLLLAFIAGILRVPASLLELAGWIPASGPGWYVSLQAFIGLVQFAIGLVLWARRRRTRGDSAHVDTTAPPATDTHIEMAAPVAATSANAAGNGHAH